MRDRRGVDAVANLCSGPGKLCQALGITHDQDGASLDRAPFELRSRAETPRIVTGPRIGITRATELSWRYGLEGSPFLSRRFRA
jgi:DNA-3-methyladenine glycosylase